VNDRLRLQWTVTVVIMAFSLYSPNSDGLQLIVSVSTILRRCLGLLPRGERVKKTWSIWGKNTGRKGGCGVLCNLESSSNGNGGDGTSTKKFGSLAPLFLGFQRG
jgi:hypothetical protein